MKKIGIFFGLFLSFWFLVGEPIGELESQLESMTGRKRIETLVKLSEYFQQTVPQKSLEYAQQIIDLSANDEYFEERVIAHKLKGLYYYEHNNNPQALASLQAGLAISEDKEFQNHLADLSYYIGRAYFYSNNYANANDALAKALDMYQIVTNKPIESQVLNYLGLVHWHWNKFAQALEYHQDALDLKQSLEDEAGVAKTLNYIGNVYLQLNNLENALENYNKSLIIYDKRNHHQGTADVFHSIGNIYKQQNDMDKALDYFIRSLRIREQLGDQIGIANCFNDIGVVHQANRTFRLANDYFNQARTIFETHSDFFGVASATSNLAKNDFLQGQYNAALRKVNESSEAARKINAPIILMGNYDLLSRIYAAQGDFKTALEHYKTYDAIKDDFFKEELRKVTELRIDYETQRKDRQIDLLQRERQIIELQLEAQKANLRTMVVLFILLCVLLIVIGQRYWTHKKARQELMKEADELKAVATTDTLTKISNKTDLMEQLEREKKRFARNQKSFVIMIADLDDFTRINEQYGTKAGDFVLRRFSNIIRSSIRRHDVIGRWGGQQFLMILPETDMQGGQIISEKIRKKIATNPVTYQDMNIYITVTIGLTIFNKDIDIETLVGKAEKALDTGKKRGKNCVIIAAQ